MFVTACAVLQVRLPLWALVHVPAVVTITTTFFTRSGWIYALLYVLFENAMGIVKLGAVVAGALVLRFLHCAAAAGMIDPRPKQSGMLAM